MKKISFKTLRNGLMPAFSVSAISAIMLLSACGQRGPLYHPEPPPPISKSNPEVTPSTAPNSTQKSTKQ